FKSEIQVLDFKKFGGESATYLFFGCRSPEYDFLYRSELEEFITEGTLDRLTVSFSRAGDRRKYVQHDLLASAVDVWDIIHNKGGALYVCGSALGMAHDVSTTIITIFQQVGGMNTQEANSYFQQLQQCGRYNEDVWG
ncbi:MFS transporter multidrug-resistance type transporter, partial [Basidiobolus ranarum]